MFAKLEPKFPDVLFIKVDVEEVEEIAQEYQIRSMPTFMLFKNGEKVKDIIGAVPAKLEVRSLLNLTPSTLTSLGFGQGGRRAQVDLNKAKCRRPIEFLAPFTFPSAGVLILPCSHHPQIRILVIPCGPNNGSDSVCI